MKWADWTYFTNNWEHDLRLEECRRQRTAGKIARAEYKARIQVVQQGVLKRMFEEGRITEEDVRNPGPPKEKKVRRPVIGKKVSIAKAVPAHGKAHKLKHPFKYTSVFEGGLPGLGKK